MTTEFEKSVLRVAVEKFGFSDESAAGLLKKNDHGEYVADWVKGYALGWQDRGKSDSAKPSYAPYHQFTSRHEWLVDSHDKDICIDLGGGDYLTIAQIGHIDVLELAGDGCPARFYYGPESVANAYLMRAAPQLLRALEDLVDWRAKGPAARSMSLENAQAAINAALMITPGKTIETDGDAAEFEAV